MYIFSSFFLRSNTIYHFQTLFKHLRINHQAWSYAEVDGVKSDGHFITQQDSSSSSDGGQEDGRDGGEDDPDE